MPTAENAKLQYEAGQNSVAQTALTDSGDRTTFTSVASIWSGRAGFSPVVRPNGLLTGGAITTNVTASAVTVAAMTANLAGVVAAVGSGTLACARPATAVSKVVSVTVNSAGVLTAVPGTDGATTAFSEARGAVGGPPLIPVGSIEIGQVRYVSNVAAVVLASEIYQVVGLHTERADFPLFDVNFNKGSVGFLDAIPAIHTGTLPKGIFASYAAPIFADVALASDFVAPETSNSVTSTQVYGATLGSTSSTLNQGSFTAYLTDGVTDALVVLKNANLWFRFYPDRYKSPYILSQGKLGISRAFPAGDNLQATCTVSASVAAVEVA